MHCTMYSLRHLLTNLYTYVFIQSSYNCIEHLIYLQSPQSEHQNMTTIDCFGGSAIWISWFLPRHSFLFWFKLIGPEPFWKATGRCWVEVFVSGTAWPKLEGKGGVGSCCCWQGIDFSERCNVNSDDFVEFCEFQSSIKQPAISKVPVLEIR